MAVVDGTVPAFCYNSQASSDCKCFVCGKSTHRPFTVLDVGVRLEQCGRNRIDSILLDYKAIEDRFNIDLLGVAIGIIRV